MSPLFVNTDQGSSEWLKMRLGVITASEVHNLMPDKRTGKHKAGWNTYMNELIGEVCTGFSEELSAKALDWGKSNEDAARAAFALSSGLDIEKVGFVYKDHTRRAGVSPDLKVIGKDHGGELKCPITPRVHIDFILDGTVKENYTTQCQFGLWCTRWSVWDFASYHPRMNAMAIHWTRQEANPETQAIFDLVVPQFIFEMDKKLEQIGIKFGDQWL